MADIRKATEAASIQALYDLAFPEEDLSGLLASLLALGSGVLSLGVYEEARLVGHAIFTRGQVGAGQAGLLGPLAVHPDRQRQGLGKALIAEGLSRLQSGGVAQVFVLGDPEYYRRSGFMRETRVDTPCPIPPDWAAAWQSQTLGDAAPLGPGKLQLPEPWLDPALWLA